MSAKHTPGPWRPEFGNNLARVIAGAEHEIAEVPMLRSTNAEVDQNRDVMIANARLIAAAPDLLQALQLLEEFATATVKQLGPTSRPEMLDRIKHARKAIAKAEGKR
jgi:hypothetical protein